MIKKHFSVFYRTVLLMLGNMGFSKAADLGMGDFFQCTFQHFTNNNVFFSLLLRGLNFDCFFPAVFYLPHCHNHSPSNCETSQNKGYKLFGSVLCFTQLNLFWNACMSLPLARSNYTHTLYCSTCICMWICVYTNIHLHICLWVRTSEHGICCVLATVNLF